MTAAEIAHALGGGRRGGGGWTARCPAHDDRNPSLSLREAPNGRLLVYCHAGCEQARVIEALRDRGLWPTNDRFQGRITRPQWCQPGQSQHDGQGADRTAVALRIWQSAAPTTGTLVETYLRSRGIDIALPTSLHFHPALPHPSGGVWPCMVALVTCGTDDEPMAVHRTFLSRDGTSKAPIEPQRMILGRCHGGAVRLGNAQPDRWLVLAEGVETALSVAQACGLPGWAALSANGLRNLTLPPEAAMVLVCTDNDANGTGQRAASEAARRFLREGRRVRIATPVKSGTDFNDLLQLPDLGPLSGEARDVA
jgi:putative DNA primase/helicase